MTETLDAIDPRRSALLVMDYQSGILGRLENADELIERADRAIALARSRGATVG